MRLENEKGRIDKISLIFSIELNFGLKVFLNFFITMLHKRYSIYEKFNIRETVMGISFTTAVKKIQDDGNFKKMTFQASPSHRPLELVFSETNSSIIEGEDWQEGDQVVVKIERITK